eukprot:TRINITY_DN14113_c0_g1_i1.p2 TRINITY_DN14113_c0_g1~~TRINITY_DN14113_c0_g1_i1.p2  ORF type:complete len:127 (-),score=31.67 TRINITY_DN14113_c0_g1_i1:26-406(-)
MTIDHLYGPSALPRLATVRNLFAVLQSDVFYYSSVASNTIPAVSARPATALPSTSGQFLDAFIVQAVKKQWQEYTKACNLLARQIVDLCDETCAESLRLEDKYATLSMDMLYYKGLVGPIVDVERA